MAVAGGQALDPGLLMLVLNLGCGSKTSEMCTNIDWSPYLRIKNNAFLRLAASPFMGPSRRQRLAALSENVIAVDMRKGLPFGSDSVDVVYHSHVLEHIDREDALSFQREIFRVLKPGGIQRICVPDLEYIARNYISALDVARAGEGEAADYDRSIRELLEQSVRREAYGTSLQPPFRRWLENIILGDARRQGETHQWMYDSHSLRALLLATGFQDIALRGWNESAVPEWGRMGLEVDNSGGEYKPGSIYAEARKPPALELA